MAQQPVNSFEIEDFILSLREFICKYPITIRELLKIQSLIKDMLVCYDSPYIYEN